MDNVRAYPYESFERDYKAINGLERASLPTAEAFAGFRARVTGQLTRLQLSAYIERAQGARVLPPSAGLWPAQWYK